MSYTLLTGGLKYTDSNNVEHTYDGLRGEVGPAPGLTIGTVTTLAAGASATATITGSSPNYVLNLGIPRGDPGVVYSATEPQNPTVGMIWLQPVS